MLTDADWAAYTAPGWLVEGVLPAGSFAVLYAPEASGKTFVALDLAASVSTGTRWQGRAVTRGPVVYIIAEGGQRFDVRLEAWRRARQQQDTGIGGIDKPVRLESASIGKLIEQVKDNRPALIVFDTLARCLGEENDTAAMKEAIDAVDQLRKETGAAILLLHHPGKDASKGLRGNSSLPAAADTILRIHKKANHLRITCDKQKDYPPFDAIHLRLVPVPLADDRSSCVVERDERSQPDHADSPNCQRMMEALAAIGQPTSAGDWQRALPAKGREGHIPRATFFRLCQELVDGGHVLKNDRRYQVSSLTGVSRESHETRSPVSLTSPTTLKGWDDETKTRLRFSLLPIDAIDEDDGHEGGAVH